MGSNSELELERFRSEWQREVLEKQKKSKSIDSQSQTEAHTADLKSNNIATDEHLLQENEVTQELSNHQNTVPFWPSHQKKPLKGSEPIEEDVENEKDEEEAGYDIEDSLPDALAQMNLLDKHSDPDGEYEANPDSKKNTSSFHDRSEKLVKEGAYREDMRMTPDQLDVNMNKSERALKIYEMAVEREQVGNLSDALRFYRQAFRLDDTVDKIYKNTHFPISSFKKATSGPTSKTLPKSSSIPSNNNCSRDILSEFADENMEPEDEELPSPLMLLPNEILNVILRALAVMDLSTFTKTTYACKKLAYLAYSDSVLWRSLCMKEYTRMNYEIPIDENEAIQLWNHDWRRMFLERPRIQYNGIYISTCNYQRSGISDSWYVPIHIVTYYRYIRFFEDGTCLIMLTTREPIEVVPEFHRHLMRRNMFKGNWRMSMDGRLRIESQAPVNKYLFLQELEIKSSGRGRHNRLNWIGFWSFNRFTADQHEFSLQHEKPFYFSRVLSYDREPRTEIDPETVWEAATVPSIVNQNDSSSNRMI
ncbi:hypothetical protein V1511DRAFT_520771 [Dipodascopsis uninucleata]